jgi:hypothetical protein
MLVAKVAIKRQVIQQIIDALASRAFGVIGPTVRSTAP